MSISFTIITPTLNAERYLAECLASVRAQSAATIEHLVVDGGSTDGTERIAREAGAVFVDCPGSRQSAAINVGLRQAHGSVVAWLNADDIYRPGALHEVAERFAADPHVDLVYGDCDVIDARGEMLWRARPGPRQFEQILRRGNSVYQPAVFMRRRVFDLVGYLDETLEYAQDYDLWLRLRDRPLAYIPMVLAAFRWHPDSKTARHNRANWQELHLIVRRYGGGWTPQLAWSYARAQLTLTRQWLARRAAS